MFLYCGFLKPRSCDILDYVMSIPAHLIASSTFASVSQAATILSHPTVDVVVLLALVGGGLFYGIAGGRRKIASSLLLTYVALAVFPVLPIEALLNIAGVREKAYALMAAFIVLVFILVFFLGARRRGFGSSGAFWQIFLLSFLQAGLIVHTMLGFLPPDRIRLLAPMTRTVFASSGMHIWWLLLPVVVLAVVRHMETRDD